ncbi:sulfatase-modifying factor protein [Marinomonas agarivorans]|nr:sulfatase-modifying factor protein [Marinomonas agarivorans]
MNRVFKPEQLRIGQSVGVELEPYVLNYALDKKKTNWIADQTGRPFSLRFYEENRGSTKDFLANARKHAGLKHPAITPIYPPFSSPFWVFSISAVCGGEKLYSFLGKYPDGAPLNVILGLFDSMAQALDKVHKNQLSHGHLDLNSIQVVNGSCVMVDFGCHNWLTAITADDMDLRFAPPEYLRESHNFTPAADRFAFMRLLIAALLGESAIDKYIASKKLPDTAAQLSQSTWKKIKLWSRPALRHRPKSLVEVIRVLRADMYANANGNRSERENTEDDIRKKALYVTGALAGMVLVTLLTIWGLSSTPNIEESEPPTTTLVNETKSEEKAVEEVQQAKFEALPKTLSEPLKAGGEAPVVEKLPPANFMMGDQQGIGDDNEKPAHLVKIPTGFYLSRYEVTFEQYDLFASATGRPLPLDNGWGRGNRPVMNVSWYDAKAYTIWLTEQTGQHYRLPTEIEWEYSIRAGSDLSYWYGNEVKAGYSVCDECGSEWDGISTAPVGSQISNPFGLFDMHGNVAEWVEDCYHDTYHNAPKENIIWFASPCDKRVLRGGSWFDIPRVGRSSTRYPASPELKASNWGFRVVRVIPKEL